MSIKFSTGYPQVIHKISTAYPQVIHLTNELSTGYPQVLHRSFCLTKLYPQKRLDIHTLPTGFFLDKLLSTGYPQASFVKEKLLSTDLWINCSSNIVLQFGVEVIRAAFRLANEQGLAVRSGCGTDRNQPRRQHDHRQRYLQPHCSRFRLRN